MRDGREREKGNKRVTEMYIVSTYCIPGNFVSLNFHEYDDFNNFTKNIFANDPRVGNIKGVAWQYFAEFSFATEQNLQNL